jgi:hypothetical protein
MKTDKELTDEKYLKRRRDRVRYELLMSEHTRLGRPLTCDEIEEIEASFKTAEALSSPEENLKTYREALLTEKRERREARHRERPTKWQRAHESIAGRPKGQ